VALVQSDLGHYEAMVGRDVISCFAFADNSGRTTRNICSGRGRIVSARKMLVHLSVIMESHIGGQFWRKVAFGPGTLQTEQDEKLFQGCWLWCKFENKAYH